MSEENREIPHHEIVDRFIALANEFTKTQSKERVGAALMFAAARYNAFEASFKSKNLLNDKSDAITWYNQEYRRMLDANFDDLIALP